jgi:hypothetical protein
MNPYSPGHNDSRASSELDGWQPNTGPIALLHVAIASAAVVGFFAAVAQPLGAASAIQAMLCIAIGVALWAASPKVDVEQRTERGPARVLARRPAALHHDL